MFQEFQLSVTPVGGDRYLVRTEKVAPGVPLAEEQVQWPTKEWLEQAKQLMNDPFFTLMQDQGSLRDNFLFIVGEQDNGNTQQATLKLTDLGIQLYDALFCKSLRDSWIAAQSIAHNQQSVLRLRLGIQGAVLPRLPWEVLHSQESHSLFRPLATGSDIAFSRYLKDSPSSSLLRLRSPAKRESLRILMAIAQPDDQERLSLQQEALHLQQELEQNAATGFPKLELTILEQPGSEELTQALEQGNYQIFHYSGHSDSGDNGGGIYLVSGQTGLTERLYGEDLAGLLVNNGIQLAVFNSCRSADTVLEPDFTQTPERNLARSLIKRGVPAVLAMAERIPDEVALTLTRLFYRNLNLGYPIDLSLSRARQGLISAYGSNQLYWALPVLYLHPEFNGQLLDIEETPNPLELEDHEEFPVELLTGETPLNEDTNWIDADTLDHFEGDEDEFLNSSQEEDEFLNPSQEEDEFLNPSPEETNLEEQEAETFIKSVLKDFSEPDETPTETPDEPPTEVEKTDLSPQVSVSSPPKKKRPKGLTVILGGVVALILALGGVWFWQNRPLTWSQLLNVSPESIDPETVDFDKVSTEQLTSVAIAQFDKNNLDLGIAAVTELLNRNTLSYAESALVAVPNEDLNNPKISFLRGRLAWQSLIINEGNYSIDDARRYWEIAVKGNPKSIEYYTALGFAFYAEGKFNQANQAWYDALELIENESESNPNANPLDTYAGLALGLSQLAQESSGEQATKLKQQSQNLYQKVLNEAPIEYQAQSLGKNWLWTEKMIQDWENLSQ